MVHWKKGFPIKYLQVSDLDGGPLVGTIKHVRSEDIGSGENVERKLVVSFVEPSKAWS